MYAKFEDTYPDTFIVSEETIRSIVVLAEPHFEEVAINASCNDKTFRGFCGVDELASYPNSRASGINILSINGHDGRSQELNEFSLIWAIGDSGSRSSVKLKLSGDNKTVSSLRTTVKDKLEATRPWYWRICKLETGQVHMIFFAIWFLYAALKFVELTHKLFFSESERAEVKLPPMDWNTFEALTWLLIAVVIGVTVLLGLIHWLIIKPKRYFFPSGTFLIGAEKTRHENHEKLRLLYLGAILSVLIAIVIAML